VRFDAAPERVYVASVTSVAAVPTSSESRPGSTGAATYSAVLAIASEVENSVPGMSACAEIQVSLLKNVLTIPAQAVVEQGEEKWCYVQRGRKLQKRPLKLGHAAADVMQVTSGLNAGDQIVLNPSASWAG
jgi:hypothetical protein